MGRECDPMCFVFIKKGLTDCICENDGNGVCKTIHDPETVQKGKFHLVLTCSSLLQIVESTKIKLEQNNIFTVS